MSTEAGKEVEDLGHEDASKRSREVFILSGRKQRLIINHGTVPTWEESNSVPSLRHTPHL